MTDPMLTVAVLAVLWLMVVVPMVVQRKDERAGQRSMARFASAMRALGSRRTVESADVPSPIDTVRATPAVHVSGAVGGTVSRRPVPASKESLMFAPNPQDMSEARRQMLVRRRRSLAVLTLASVVLLIVAILTSSIWLWTPGLIALAALAGYLIFLRSQARRDRARRQNRRERASTARPIRDYDATAAAAVRTSQPESAVRIDEDDVDLDHLDTVDLTGLYSEVELRDTRIRRAG